MADIRETRQTVASRNDDGTTTVAERHSATVVRPSDASSSVWLWVAVAVICVLALMFALAANHQPQETSVMPVQHTVESTQTVTSSPPQPVVNETTIMPEQPAPTTTVNVAPPPPPPVNVTMPTATVTATATVSPSSPPADVTTPASPLTTP